MDISVYSFRDADGEDAGEFKTQNFEEARQYAQKNSLCVVENVYEWQEAIPVDGADFTANRTGET